MFFDDYLHDKTFSSLHAFIYRHFFLKAMEITRTRICCFILVLCLLGCALTVSAKQYKIALVHSYEEGYIDASRCRAMLLKELQVQGVYCEFKDYYLNCDEYVAKTEEQLASRFIDDFTEWGADLVAVFDDQATYSLMACGNPKLRQLPVVFGGVNYPNEKLLGQYPNVTGYVDTPDYLRTIGMIERIMGKSRICVISGQTFLDRLVWKDLNEQCAGQDFEICEENLNLHLIHNGVVKGPFERTIIMKFVSDSLSLRSVTWAGRGRSTLLLFTKRDYTTVNSAALFYSPCFETINEGFGTLDHKLGGYFAPFETQMKDMAVGIKQRLLGEMPRQQMQQSAKQYVVNWHTLQRYHIPVSSIPPEYVIMYTPFVERYFYSILCGSLLAVLVLLTSFFLLFRGLLKIGRAHV